MGENAGVIVFGCQKDRIVMFVEFNGRLSLGSSY